MGNVTRRIPSSAIAKKLRPVALLLLIAILAPAQVRRPRLRRIGKNSASGVSLRKRTSIDSLIAEGGTMEIDWASLYSFSNQSWSQPMSMRATPGISGFWGRTELGLSTDTHTATFTGTTMLVQSDHFDVAVAPQATFFLRDSAGARLGGLAIVRYDQGSHSLSATLNWTAATHPQDGNPHQLADFGLGYTWRRGRWSPHVNVVREVATAYSPTLSLFEGVSYDLTNRLSLDVSMQHFSIQGGITDHQLLVGLNISGIRVHR